MGSSAASSSSAAPAANVFGAGVLAMCPSSSTAPAVNASGGAPLDMCPLQRSDCTWKNRPPPCYPVPPPPIGSRERAKRARTIHLDSPPVGEAIVNPPPVGEAIAGEATADAYVETQPNETQLNVNPYIDVSSLGPDSQLGVPDESEDLVHDGQLPHDSQLDLD